MKLIKKLCLTVIIILLFLSPASLVFSEEPTPVAWWKFDAREDDNIKGNYRYVEGVSGSAVKLDGYTSYITRPAASAPELSEAFTIEAWVAVAAFPWNWCPVVSRQQGKKAGYAFELGPQGELRLGVFAGGGWKECLTEEKIAWKKWAHIVGTYNSTAGLKIFINGKEVGRLSFKGKISEAKEVDILLGSIQTKKKPAFIHREFGTLADWFSLDAILDEVKLYDRALDPGKIEQMYASEIPLLSPDISPRVLPSGPPGPGRFGAYYTRLQYYWEWDDMWRVSDHPDVVVQFDDSPVRVVFWRGTRFSPAWVTENNLWMADQSVEAWDNIEGCFEHMQDSQCKYSHVRILENTPARVVVHWRYAPVSSRNHLWRSDKRTGWACWVDEYYYFYPDQTGIRKVMWQRDSLGQPRQFQESIPFTGPGQVQGDVIHEDYVTIANLKGETQVFNYIKNPPKKTTKYIPKDPLIQRHNLKAKNKPFIIFEPGGKMHYLKDMNINSLSRPGSCSHWPVGQLPSDGRTSKMPDRASSFLGFPITDPLEHKGREGRNWVNSLYGMGERSMEELALLAKSWVQAPKLKVISGDYKNRGYDLSQRAYILLCPNSGIASQLILEIEADKDNPVSNLCLVVKGWGGKDAVLTLDGKQLKPGIDFTCGHVKNLKGNDLIVWVERKSIKPIIVTIIPE